MRDLWEVAAQAFEPPRYPTPHSVQALVSPETAENPRYLQYIDQQMMELLGGRNDRLMASVPPQHGKSSRLVRAGVLWWLHHRPNDRVVIASFEWDTAARWGRIIRNDVEAHPELGLRIRKDSRSAGRWELERTPDGRAGGGVYCVGLGGALTGRAVDLLVLDDVVKGRAWAESQTYRDRAGEWWANDCRTRLGATSKAIVVGTRWHTDDAMGRIQNSEPGRWKVLNLPALAEGDDPLGRAQGEALGGVRGQTREFLEETRDSIGPYAFASLYQGRPAPAEGGLFKRADLRYWERPDTSQNRHLQQAAAPGEVVLLDGQPTWLRDCYVFATVDLAASTKTSADFTVAAVWAHTHEGHLVLLDLVRARVDDTRHGELVLPLVRRWAPDFVGVEDSGRSVNLSAELGRAGVAVRPLKADVDKVTRALPASARVARHQLWLPRTEDSAGWLEAMLGELLSFPNGAHDDTVDVLSYAARIVAGAASSAVAVKVPEQQSTQALLAQLGPSGTNVTARSAPMVDYSGMQF